MCIMVALPMIITYLGVPLCILLGVALLLDTPTMLLLLVYLIVCSPIVILLTAIMVLNNDHYSSRIIIKITTIITTLSDIVPLNGMALRPIDEVYSPPIKNG